MPAVDPAEQILIVRAKAGDREAFGVLVAAHMRRAYYAALGLVGSHDDALDLSQEAFVRVYRARNKLDPERPFYPWLYQTLRRLCFNWRRDRATRRRLEGAADWLIDRESRAERADPARAVERAELRVRLAGAIAELPDHERETLVLREFEGLKYGQIAELLDVPIGTVMSRLYSARRRLAASLAEEQ